MTVISLTLLLWLRLRPARCVDTDRVSFRVLALSSGPSAEAPRATHTVRHEHTEAAACGRGACVRVAYLRGGVQARTLLRAPPCVALTFFGLETCVHHVTERKKTETKKDAGQPNAGESFAFPGRCV
jgi:hypothetical protein